MNTYKSIQIDFQLFQRMISYISSHSDTSDPAYEVIYNSILQKLESMEKHALFTVYKTAPDIKSREKARQKYLDMMGIPESFRWPAKQDRNVTREDL